jgi:hypothetical protein
MANKRGYGRGGFSDETRIAPLEDDPPEEAQEDVPTHLTRFKPVPLQEEDDATREISSSPVSAMNRTVFSSRAALIADLLRDKFSSRFFGRPPYRVLRVDEPEGPSTAGGRLARQPISLVSRQGSAPSIVCGWVDTAKGEAQLRSYESVSKRYESHHGVQIDLSAEHYERFLNDLETTFMAGGIKVRVLVGDEPGAPPAQGQGQGQAQAPRATAARARSKPKTRIFPVVLAFLLGLAAGRVVPWEKLEALVRQLLGGAQ